MFAVTSKTPPSPTPIRVVLGILGRYDELAGSMIVANDGLDIPLVPLNLDPNDELPDDADW